MIDEQGYRANIGIVITNNSRQILLAKRIEADAWQLPQGGINFDETELDALFRELNEEVGLCQNDVKIIAKTPKWLRYKLPAKHIKRHKLPLCIGQKQVWFLLKLTADESKIKLDNDANIEFDNWRWVDYWQPIDEVVGFKKSVYEDMLKAFAPVLFDNKHQVPKQYSRPLKCCAIMLS